MMSHVGGGSSGAGADCQYDTNKIYSFINNANNYNNQNREAAGINFTEDNDEDDFVDDDCGDDEGDEYGI